MPCHFDRKQVQYNKRGGGGQRQQRQAKEIQVKHRLVSGWWLRKGNDSSCLETCIYTKKNGLYVLGILNGTQQGEYDTSSAKRRPHVVVWVNLHLGVGKRLTLKGSFDHANSSELLTHPGMTLRHSSKLSGSLRISNGTIQKCLGIFMICWILQKYPICLP